ncbi:outer membrane protein assembly factor BamB [Candidatus Albibeggiatoa sp. nov. NOAA]|uniref:outer membrane protein assembly factor BamB n=1 Tax=Candidatus Albibeggiatoa sp. nov. NOAA TaxID=3162724 RepID=UPI0032F1E979|nr:outer membrane protein assembly factor BamB [Thiotrichaceae bacterium]
MKQLLIFILAISVASCGIFKSKDNNEPPAELAKLDNALDIKTLWNTNLSNDDELYSKLIPAYQTGVLFVATTEGEVFAFDVETGKRQWKTKTKKPLSGGVGLGDGQIFVGSRDGDVLALSEENGTVLWQVKVSSEVLTPPQIASDTLIVRTVDGKIFALAHDSGTRLWVYERDMPLLTLHGTSTPIVKQDFVLAGLDNGKLAALDVATGKLFWEVPIAIPKGRSQLERMVDIDADPILDGDTVFVSSYQGRTVAIDMTAVRIAWEREVSSHTGMATDLDALYLSDLKGHVWAFDRYTGSSLWRQEGLQARKLTAPVSMDDYVVVGDLEGYLHWIRKSDGQVAARYRIGGKDHFNVAPIVVDEKLIAYNSDGKLAVLRIEE